MVRSLITGFAAALALAAALSTADAQTVRHPRHFHAAAIPPGDIVVHARSYLDPGVAASPGEIGTDNRYVTDFAGPSLGDIGPMFGNGGFDSLPRRFNPPGRPEPLFEF